MQSPAPIFLYLGEMYPVVQLYSFFLIQEEPNTCQVRAWGGINRTFNHFSTSLIARLYQTKFRRRCVTRLRNKGIEGIEGKRKRKNDCRTCNTYSG